MIVISNALVFSEFIRMNLFNPVIKDKTSLYLTLKIQNLLDLETIFIFGCLIGFFNFIKRFRNRFPVIFSRCIQVICNRF